MTAADTIYALSSGAGRAAVAVVRLSGPASSTAIQSLAGDLPPPRRFVRRALRSADGERFDMAGVLWLPGPGTATGEDMAEFHIHGSQAVAAALFRALAALPGLRPAEAGAFTRRSFVNGKLDLVEAEGLADLLEARSEGQLRQALFQFLGGSSAVVEAWRERLIAALAAVDAVVEFSDEGDLRGIADDGWRRDAVALVSEMSEALAMADRAADMRRGLRIVLAGAPNTGKSSLLNALAQRDVAIVSPLAGTTRDTIDVELDLGGVPVIVTDTAGLRAETGDEIERLGMARARRFAGAADILVWLWSCDVPGSAEMAEGLVPDLVVEAKADLAPPLGRVDSIRISTRDGAGLPELVMLLGRQAQDRVGLGEPAIIVRERQMSAVRESIRFLNDALRLPASSLELVAAELRAAADSLSRLTGRIDVEDWLDAIFSRFCIGK